MGLWAGSGGDQDAASAELGVFRSYILFLCSFMMAEKACGHTFLLLCITGADWPSLHHLMTQKENEGFGWKESYWKVLPRWYFKHLTFVNPASEENAVENPSRE